MGIASWFKKDRQSQHDHDNHKASQGMRKTRQRMWQGLKRFLGQSTMDTELRALLEDQLLSCDVGRAVTDQLLSRVSDLLANSEHTWEQALQSAIESFMRPYERSSSLPTVDPPCVVVLLGVNGAGKTTTLAKMASLYKGQGHRLMLAAGDTFRAAASEQLSIWGERHGVPVISQSHGADSAAVVFDAYQSAQAKQCDLLLADTAGRLHTQQHLMDELQKVVRVLKRCDEHAPHIKLLVLDGSIGQNCLAQAQAFQDAVGIDGVVMTKLDGTAKGGALMAVAERLQVPIYFIGVGEQADDLLPFNASDFARAFVSGDQFD